jgi:hypothetical protein
MSDFIQDMKDAIEFFNKWSNEHAILDICHKTACVPGWPPRPGSIRARNTAHRPETRRNRSHFAALRYPSGESVCAISP